MRQCLKRYFENCKHVGNEVFIINNSTVNTGDADHHLLVSWFLNLMWGSARLLPGEQPCTGTSLWKQPTSPWEVPPRKVCLHCKQGCWKTMKYVNELWLLLLEQARELRLSIADNKKRYCPSLHLKPFQALLRRICISITMWECQAIPIVGKPSLTHLPVVGSAQAILLFFSFLGTDVFGRY